MFQATTSGIVVEHLCPNYQMNDGMRDEVTTILRRSNLVFAQRVSSDYPLTWLTPAYLKETLGLKVFIWPNIYFDGYTPSVHYIYLADWGKPQSPLEDYHLHEVVDAFKLGKSVKEATILLTSTESEKGTDPFAESFRSLQNSGARCGYHNLRLSAAKRLCKAQHVYTKPSLQLRPC